jgi:hypothetical protein
MPCSGLLVGRCRQNSAPPSPAEGAPVPSPLDPRYLLRTPGTCRPQFAK